ncbi:DUF1254 domain-containing protein [Vibrio rumoiensis]|uniref:Phosphatidylserine decarboxylase n=1 Tax=Vibrio rumoiensis 1S-45 TaxID=1188252 RepID=A0A1E5E2V4_9VIBR|nr:DUF1254 domain-containing protein [Vibrio rumoiensis]OEF25898.1 hypothetical protein A1QC_07705 [Vibrio rumoiensis 1S-45]
MKKTWNKTICAALISSALFTVNISHAADVTANAQPVMNVQNPLEQESYILGVNAYLWGSTLVRMENVSRLYTDLSQKQSDTSYRAALNNFGHARRLPTDVDSDMPTANRDTLYSSAIVDLSNGPVILSVPAISDRYYVIDMFDMWHNLFQYVGTRSTGTLARNFMMVPPGWKGTAPRDVEVVESPTTKVWLWGRTQVFNEKDYPTVHAIQDKYTLTSLSEYQGGKATKVNPLPKAPGDAKDPLNFYVQLGEYLKANPLPERQQALFGQFKKIGITENGFDKSQLSPAQQKLLAQAVVDGQKIVNVQAANPSATTAKDGWYYSFLLDSFGDDNAFRSLVSHPYLGGQGAKEAMYPIAYTDIKGKPLSGQNDYTMHFDKEPPVGAFWSVTVYDAKTKLLVKNEIQRFNINDQTPITKAKDGSFNLHFSHQKPTDDTLSNWVPLPKDGFYVITRMYIPTKEVLDMKWTVPAIQPVTQ